MQSKVMAVLKQIKIPAKGVCRGGGGHSVPWKNIVKHYRLRIEKYHLGYEPMLHLVESLAASPFASELFPHTSMETLLITDNEQFYHNDNELLISYSPQNHNFKFEHRTLSGKNDKKICGEEEAFQTLGLFLKYKFGILFSQSEVTKK
jgi:hypothetical protein